MVRRARAEYLFDGCYAHVISRSIRKLKILRDREDFERFIDIIRKEKARRGFKVFHYCFMQTHFHMALQMEDVKAFSMAMLTVKSRYSYLFHEKYRMNGPIWRERYKSLLIEDEGYLQACGEYIENNPVKAGLVEDASDWPYSSARYYYEGKEDVLMDKVERKRKQANVDIFLDEEEFFERGSVIGSAFYRFQFYKGFKKQGDLSL